MILCPICWLFACTYNWACDWYECPIHGPVVTGEELPRPGGMS